MFHQRMSENMWAKQPWRLGEVAPGQLSVCCYLISRTMAAGRDPGLNIGWLGGRQHQGGLVGMQTHRRKYSASLTESDLQRESASTQIYLNFTFLTQTLESSQKVVFVFYGWNKICKHKYFSIVIVTTAALIGSLSWFLFISFGSVAGCNYSLWSGCCAAREDFCS